MAASLWRRISHLDVAVDLGTSRTAVFVKGDGLVFEEPSIISVRDGHHRNPVVAIGHQASQIRGKEPIGLKTIRPLQAGVIEQLEAAKLMLAEVARQNKIRRPFGNVNVLIGAPFQISGIERRAVREAARSFGAKSIYVVEEPIAAAIGADIDISESIANMVVDIGSGITEAVVISLGGIVHSEAIRVGGDTITLALANHFRQKCNLIVGEQTIETLKLGLCDLFGDSSVEVAVKGMDVKSRLPQTRFVKPAQVRGALMGPVNAIVAVIKKALENTPPMLAGDLMDRGIVLTGGTALLRNFDRLLEAAIGVPVRVAADPMRATVRGVSRMLDEVKSLRVSEDGRLRM